MGEWQSVKPEIDEEHEFFEISNDFSDPLEAVREAISNAYDWNAKSIKIEFKVEQIEGAATLIVRFEDDGDGMSREAISCDFWGLGRSKSRTDPTKIGEKGHGTKIFFRSEEVRVKSKGPEGMFEAICERPFRQLTSGKLHEPKYRLLEEGQKSEERTFTIVELVGYNNNDMKRFTQPIVKDYILWFTKAGSVENEFPDVKKREFTVYLKGLDSENFEEIKAGHVFPAETPDINALFQDHAENAADHYVKKYCEVGRLRNRPDVVYQAVVYVEGDKAKRSYNKMLKDRIRKSSESYKVSDRYGIWLCKHYIPVCRKNDWLTGFGTGSNAFVLLHGFVNCQTLRLTANRGDVSNTDPAVQDGLREVVTVMAEKIDTELQKADLFTLMSWQEEERTRKQEEEEFKRRIKSIKTRKMGVIAEKQNVIEPNNEAELFGLFMRIYALQPDLFTFEPLDYNTSKGIDLIARNTSRRAVSEPEHSYVEFKFILGEKPFNHTFANLRWIVCWDLARDLKDGDEFSSVVDESDKRILRFPKEGKGADRYFLDSDKMAIKIQIIRLKDFLEEKMNVKFQAIKR